MLEGENVAFVFVAVVGVVALMVEILRLLNTGRIEEPLRLVQFVTSQLLRWGQEYHSALEQWWPTPGGSFSLRTDEIPLPVLVVSKCRHHIVGGRLDGTNCLWKSISVHLRPFD